MPTESQPHISVIVPVYNVEPYIAKCLDSLIGQTKRELEFILVDDCGTDNSMDIARQYAERDPRIRILPGEKNLGAALTRNRGMEAAKGEFIAFIDSDDWIVTDYFELLYNKAKAEGADLVKGAFCMVKGDKVTHSNMNASIRSYLTRGRFPGIAFHSIFVNAIYSAELLRKHNATFPKLTNGEDIVFLLKAQVYAKKWALEDRAMYHYIQHEKSASHTIREGYYDSLFEHYRMLGEILRESPLPMIDIVEYWHMCVMMPLLGYQRTLSPDKSETFYTQYFARIRELLMNSGFAYALYYYYPRPGYKEFISTPKEKIDIAMVHRVLNPPHTGPKEWTVRLFRMQLLRIRIEKDEIKIRIFGIQALKANLRRL